MIRSQIWIDLEIDWFRPTRRGPTSRKRLNPRWIETGVDGVDVDEKRRNGLPITDLLQVIPATGSETRACNSGSVEYT